MHSKRREKIRLKDKFRYRFDNFFARGWLPIFLTLLSLFGITLFVMGSIRVIINIIYPDPLDNGIKDIGSLIWRSILQVVDIGSLAEDSNAYVYNKIVGIITSLAGLALVSTLLAFITSQFKEKLESLRKGKSAVIEKNHTIILGFGIRTIEIIRELIEANASEKDATIVVLSETDKEIMDDTLNDYLPSQKTTRIITRNGSTSNPISLKKVGITNAKSVILLNPVGPANPIKIKAQADYIVLKSLMAIIAAIGEDKMIPVIAKLHFNHNRELAEGISPENIVTIDEDKVLSKILVQTSRTSGLSLVYSDLVGFMGNEVYIVKIPENLTGLSFGDFQFYFKQSIPLGLQTIDNKILLNPAPDRIINNGEKAIILAEDDSTIKFYSKPVITPKKLDYSKKGKEMKAEKYLIYGWSTKSPTILYEYGSYIKEGSIIDIAINKITDSIQNQFNEISKQHKKIKMSIKEISSTSPDFPEQLKPEEYDNVIILAGEANNVEEIDSETISNLLKFRHYFRQKEKKSRKVISTQLITEVMDSENTEIIQQTGVKDFLISNQFVSKIMAQISQDPLVKKVYDDLFQESGSEVYLKSISYYLKTLSSKITFADLMLAAQQRNEICFGVRISDQGDTDNGHGIYIIPNKDKVFELAPNDHVIVLAKDET